METTIVSIIIDYGYKISTVIIAVANMCLLFSRNKKTDEETAQKEERNRRLSLLKTLILDYNLHYYYEIFDKIENQLEKLRDKQCDKTMVEKELQAQFRMLFEKFLNFLAIIDNGLFESVKNECDYCRDQLVSDISDQGINLWVETQYNTKIKKRVQTSKASILSLIFDYKG